MTTTAGQLARRIATLWPWEPQCVSDPYLWTGYTDAGPSLSQQEIAARMCGDCLVKTMCAEAGDGEPYVWGGKTTKQRELQGRRQAREQRRVQRANGPTTPATCWHCGAIYAKPNAHRNQRYCTEVCARAARRPKWQARKQEWRAKQKEMR